eukprot:COSAG04_NODE_709_length_10902_cov_2.887346_2_plen_127_part_00
MQAAGSWSKDACCAAHGNDCRRDLHPPYCIDRASSSDWLFGLWPGPPQRFEPTGANTYYQFAAAVQWPQWGSRSDPAYADLRIGGSGAPGEHGACLQGRTYRGTPNEICGGNNNWGATDVEVWYPR